MSRILIIGEGNTIGREIGSKLSDSNIPVDFAAGRADALHRIRSRSFGLVITSCESNVEEDLALLTEMRGIRPGVKCIFLARNSTPEEVIAALRARVFACFTPPFDVTEIAHLAAHAASESNWREDIQVISARRGWVSVRVNCRLINAERLLTFARELSHQLPDDSRQEMILALREILLNAMEHGAAFNPEQVIEVTAVRTARSLVFYVRDPGAGFRQESLTHAASPDHDPTAQAEQREKEGIRAGGYGLLMAAGTVDELIYSEIGNEVLLIKYIAPE
jgi:anti-sigma regulatory factor (Ser/Thr protein kinase)